jgi:hypothetical protein
MKFMLSSPITRAFFLGSAVLIIPVRSLAQSPQPTISWISDSAGFWDVASNWKDKGGTARVPNSSDDVLIDRGSVRPVITTRSPQSIRITTEISAAVRRHDCGLSFYSCGIPGCESVTRRVAPSTV